jgi:cleavage and polyadenylation specificity factor subunit 1
MGHFPVSLHLLPSTEVQKIGEDDEQVNGTADDEQSKHTPGRLHHVLVLTQSGTVALVNPVDEQTYRRLGALHTYLINQLEHACGLNPRGYRAYEGAARGIIDGTLLRRWTELPSSRQQEACAKLGVEEWVVRSDLEVVGGSGLSYL